MSNVPNHTRPGGERTVIAGELTLRSEGRLVVEPGAEIQDGGELVRSVNGKAGAAVLDAADIGAVPAAQAIPIPLQHLVRGHNATWQSDLRTPLHTIPEANALGLESAFDAVAHSDTVSNTDMELQSAAVIRRVPPAFDPATDSLTVRVEARVTAAMAGHQILDMLHSQVLIPGGATAAPFDPGAGTAELTTAWTSYDFPVDPELLPGLQLGPEHLLLINVTADLDDTGGSAGGRFEMRALTLLHERG